MLGTLMPTSPPPALGLLLKSLQKNNTYKKLFFSYQCVKLLEEKAFLSYKVVMIMMCITRLSIRAHIYDGIHGCTLMSGDQSGTNFIVIFYTKHLRTEWSTVTRSHEFCTKCFAGHSTMLVL